jgi:uncharacterized membrane protein YciS (DUF1049 family)
VNSRLVSMLVIVVLSLVMVAVFVVPIAVGKEDDRLTRFDFIVIFF